MKLKLGVTYQQIKDGASKKIYYSSKTVWWTDDPNDLQPGPVPLDIFGAPLFEADKIKFLRVLEKMPEHYGENGINAFMAMHHKNFTPELFDHLINYSQHSKEFFNAAVTEQKINYCI